jgi:hypothetical protein
MTLTPSGTDGVWSTGEVCLMLFSWLDWGMGFDRKITELKCIFVIFYQGYKLSAWLWLLMLTLIAGVGSICQVFLYSKVALPSLLSILLYSLQGSRSLYAVHTLLWEVTFPLLVNFSSLRIEYIYKLFGLLLHKILASSFIYLVICLYQYGPWILLLWIIIQPCFMYFLTQLWPVGAFSVGFCGPLIYFIYLRAFILLAYNSCTGGYIVIFTYVLTIYLS